MKLCIPPFRNWKHSLINLNVYAKEKLQDLVFIGSKWTMTQHMGHIGTRVGIVLIYLYFSQLYDTLLMMGASTDIRLATLRLPIFLCIGSNSIVLNCSPTQYLCWCSMSENRKLQGSISLFVSMPIFDTLLMMGASTDIRLATLRLLVISIWFAIKFKL